MKKSLLIQALSAALFAMPLVAAAAGPHTITGNAGVFSDYRFRGVSQTAKGPAFQGGFDYSHSSGFYLGNWNSNVSGAQYSGGNGLEMDFYGGYKGEIGKTGLTYDVGNIYYYYDKARVGGVNTGEKYNNNEVYFGLGYGPLTAKVFYATTDYFGLNNNNAPASGPRGDSKGTLYYDLTFAKEMLPKLTLTAHVGRTEVKNYDSLSYTDYKLGLGYDLNGFALGAALVGTTDRKQDFKTFNTTNAGTGSKKLYEDTLVLSISKSF